MKYVALLRGINVGGNRKVDMGKLKETFERAGMDEVRTYINSGNVVFSSGSTDAADLRWTLERAVRDGFGFDVRVLVRDETSIRELVDALPDAWADDETAKCDVIFLGDEVDGPEVFEHLTIKPGIDDARYVPGAVLWRVERHNVTRSGLMKLAGTELYAATTLRNCNTVRKIAALMR